MPSLPNFDDLWDGIDDLRAATGREVAVPGTLFGAEGITNPDILIWAESEHCARAIREAGYQQTVSLIPAPGRDLFAPLRDHQDLLAKAGKIIIAGGSAAFVEEVARRLGRHRCFRVRWPGKCGDVCGTMQNHGAQAVRDALEAAEPYPIEGVHRPSAAAMLAHRHAPLPPVLTTGCRATDQVLKLPGEGKLVLVSGIPNHGKSTWMTHLMAHTAERHSRRWAVFSPEMGEWPHLAACVMSWRAGKPFRTMADDEVAVGAQWCEPRFAFLACDGEDAAPTLDWVLNLARICILRDGTTDILVDPWNELQHDEGGQAETAYIGRALQRLRAFATRHCVNVWIIAHPVKLRPLKPGEPVPVPTAYDIAGSGHWANKSDLILVVHRPETVTQVHVVKSRFSRWGRKGSVAEIELDPTTGRFRSAAIGDAYRDQAPADQVGPATWQHDDRQRFQGGIHIETAFPGGLPHP